MNEALQRWREDFVRDPGPAFDRLVRGVVPLGGFSQLSFGEILDHLFEPGDAALDAAAAGWLDHRILGPIPENTSLQRWVAVLEEFFRGIAAMELPRTGQILRRQHKRLRLWLHGFYEGPDRDPEGAYLIALARAQDDQRFSTLWRRIILGEELAGRSYLAIGILGFRKMPDQAGRESSGVPEGLPQALVALADKPGTVPAKWKQTVRGLFATYRRSESYWVEHLAPLLPHYQQQSNARDWLSALLPGIRNWRPPTAEFHVPARKSPPVPVKVSIDWVKRVRNDPSLCDTPEFEAFLDQHRAYAESSGDTKQIRLALNNLSTTLMRADRTRAGLAIGLIEEALYWAPWDPRNWTSYAIVLRATHREGDAIDALWHARQRFPWYPYIRNLLGRILGETGDLSASEGVLREAATHFPDDALFQNGLAGTLRALGRLEEALEVYEKACLDFPNDVPCRNGWAETLRTLGRPEEARAVYEKACLDFPNDAICRSGLAETLRALGRLEEAREVYEKACLDFPEDAVCWRGLLLLSQKTADDHLAGPVPDQGAASEDLIVTERLGDSLGKHVPDGLRTLVAVTENDHLAELATHESASNDGLSVAERLGRAMISLWQAERANDSALKLSLCADAKAFLEISEDTVEEDFLPAFVETSGLILLASGDASGALAYFENQIHSYGRGGWFGVRLGEQRARILLGEPVDSEDTAEPSSSQSVRFALYVARVIQALTLSPLESEVREFLKALYPRAARFAARTQADAEGVISIESGAETLGIFLLNTWFRPAGIQSAADLDSSEALRAVVERIRSTRAGFDVISNSTLALAA